MKFSRLNFLYLLIRKLNHYHNIYNVLLISMLNVKSGIRLGIENKVIKCCLYVDYLIFYLLCRYILILKYQSFT